MPRSSPFAQRITFLKVCKMVHVFFNFIDNRFLFL
jgi:hypothetical protein